MKNKYEFNLGKLNLTELLIELQKIERLRAKVDKSLILSVKKASNNLKLILATRK